MLFSQVLVDRTAPLGKGVDRLKVGAGFGVAFFDAGAAPATAGHCVCEAVRRAHGEVGFHAGLQGVEA